MLVKNRNGRNSKETRACAQGCVLTCSSKAGYHIADATYSGCPSRHLLIGLKHLRLVRGVVGSHFATFETGPHRAQAGLELDM